jgi:hypothetical protein
MSEGQYFHQHSNDDLQSDDGDHDGTVEAAARRNKLTSCEVSTVRRQRCTTMESYEGQRKWHKCAVGG